MPAMRVLVTGAGGFLAHHLIPRLVASGHTVLAWSRATNASAHTQRRLADLRQKLAASVEWLSAGEPAELREMLRRQGPEVCVHLAGRSSVRESLQDPELYTRSNYRTTAALLETLRACRCRRVVFASTSMVYGPDAPQPCREDQLGTAPSSPYGTTKLACEQLLNSHHEQYGLETISLRIFSVLGPEMRPDCVPFLIAGAILASRPFTIFGDGSSLRDYIDVTDVAAALEMAVAGRQSWPAVNIGSGQGTAILELLALFEQALGKKAVVVHKPAVAGELPVVIPAIDMAASALGWRPRIALGPAVERMARWIRGSRVRGPGSRV